MASVFWKAIFCASLAVALPVFAQQEKVPAKEEGPSTKEARSSAKEAKPGAGRRFSYGFRVEAYPLPLFKTSTATSSTVKPIADYTYTATTSSQKAAPGASVTYRLTDRIS